MLTRWIVAVQPIGENKCRAFTINDSKAPNLGDVTNGFSNDPTPTLDFTLPSGLTAGDKLVIDWGGGSKTVRVTQDDITSGTLSTNIPKLTANGEYTFSASIYNKTQTTDLFDYARSRTRLIRPSRSLVASTSLRTTSSRRLRIQAASPLLGIFLAVRACVDGDAVTITLTDRAVILSRSRAISLA